jgi:hypothetical protein
MLAALCECRQESMGETWLCAAGSLIARHADARFVQEFLGHSRITTTERYMHAKARPRIWNGSIWRSR